MIEIGYTNRMQILRKSDNGLYLNGEDLGEILLPNKYVPEDYKIGEEIDAFVYTDSEDRLVATTQTPYAHVGQFAWLECLENSRVGAFLDWGLDKDLFLPFSEQKDRPMVGRKCFVYIYLDTREIKKVHFLLKKIQISLTKIHYVCKFKLITMGKN